MWQSGRNLYFKNEYYSFIERNAARVNEKKSPKQKKSSRTLSLRHHKASGQGYVVLNDTAVYLGKYGEPGTIENYHKVLAEWLVAGRQLPAEQSQITVNEVLARFWVYAEDYYKPANNDVTNELEH